MKRVKTDQSAGVAGLEVLVVVLVLAAIVAGGVYVYDHRSVSASTNSGNTATAQPGTTANIDQLTQSAAQTEEQADHKSDPQIQSDALSANAAASNVGGAYNESTL